MLSFLIGLVGAIVSLVGWFGFQSIIMVVIGTLLYLIETLVEWRQLNVGAKIIDFIIFAIGCIITLFLSIPWYIGGMLAIAVYSLIMSIISLIGLFFSRQ